MPSPTLAETDLPLAKAWKTFRDTLGKFFENVDSTTVDLYFDSSLNETTHFTFQPDEAIYYSDLKVTAAGRVAFCVPYGAKEKSFYIEEAELITTTHRGTTRPLDQVINDHFLGAFAGIADVNSINMLERKYLKGDANMILAFNDIDAAIKDFNLNRSRASKYAKLDIYGLF